MADKQRGGQRKPQEEKSENRTVGLPKKLWAPIDKMPGSLAGRMRIIVAAGLDALGRSGINVGQMLAEHYHNIARELWDEKYGYVSKETGQTPQIKVIDFSTRITSSALGSKGECLVIVAQAEIGGLRSTFSFRLDGTWFQYEDEEEINDK